MSSTIDHSEVERIGRDLKRIVSGEVRVGHHDRMLYATDASIYQVEPLGVVIPRTMEDIVATLQYGAEHKVPVLPRGGGTSLAGQTVNRALVIDCSVHLREVIEIDPERRIARVQPGVVLDQLNAAAARHELMFGPDVATSAHANLGGMIGNNSAGAHSVLYGRTVEHLRALDVLLADASRIRLDAEPAPLDSRIGVMRRRVAEVIRSVESEIDARFPQVLRRVSGYNLDVLLSSLRESANDTGDMTNLAKLVCGSEGTLAVTLEAEVDLVPVPTMKGLAIVSYESVDAAIAAVPALLETGPAAVELIDDVVIDVALRNLEHRPHVDLLPRQNGSLPRAVLYVEYFAEDPQELDDQFRALNTLARGCGIAQYDEAESMGRAWALRKAGEPLLHAIPGRRKPISFIEDLAVDPGRLNDLVTGFREITARHGTRAAYYAHASVGCLHIRPLIDLHDEADRETMVRIAGEATDLVRSLGGALSGEHGDGRARSPLLERYFGAPIVEAFRAIKSIFDPDNLLNPGNIVEPAPMTRHLRVLPRDRAIDVPDVATNFRFERGHGFRESVWQCNGAGVCRRTTGGTMCPSYRATLDERHATRGRANALRLAITGQVGNGADVPVWDDDETLKTLDLCLSCKACKAECPSNVDVARLKSEYLSQTYRQRGKAPRSIQIFGDIRRHLAMASRLPAVSNLLLRFPPIRSATNRLLELHPRRSIPRVERSLYAWRRSRRGSNGRNAPAVALLPDCFTVYQEPHIGRAAIRVLEALGYRVLLPRMGCCGRPQISLGLLDRAAVACAESVRALAKLIRAEEPVAIVGLEPSCISAVTDDWVDLKLDADSEDINVLSDRTMLIETFLAERWDEHPKSPHRFAIPLHRTALLHGHCHQKALWGVAPTVELLRRIDRLSVSVVDSGCCGMAGAFGMTADRFDLSMQIGELSVFPPIREAPESIVLAPGASCRHQIRDGTNRIARHPIELIAEAMIDVIG